MAWEHGPIPDESMRLELTCPLPELQGHKKAKAEVQALLGQQVVSREGSLAGPGSMFVSRAAGSVSAAASSGSTFRRRSTDMGGTMLLDASELDQLQGEGRMSLGARVAHLFTLQGFLDMLSKVLTTVVAFFVVRVRVLLPAAAAPLERERSSSPPHRPSGHVHVPLRLRGLEPRGHVRVSESV